jgi:hypothetical protein
VLNITAHIEPVRDVFAAEHFTELKVTIQADVPIGGPENDLHFPEFRVIGVGHEIDWVVEVDVVIVVAMHERFNIVSTTEVKQVTYHIRMTKCKVTGAKAAKANASASDFISAGVVPNLRYPFFGEEAIVLDMAFHAVLRVDVSVPTVVVNTVRAKDLHETTLHEPAETLDHSSVFGLAVATQSGRKNHKRITFGTGDMDFNVAAEMMAVEIN